LRINVINRQDDKFPILIITASNYRESVALKKLMEETKAAQEIGVKHGVAKMCYPPVGCSLWDNKGNIESISFRFLIGD